MLVVGNLVAGGAGKTPVVLGICRHLKTLNRKVGLVSRGYGRRNTHTLVVSPGKRLPTAQEIGDEPRWLAQETGCPVAVGQDRQKAVQALLQAHPDLDLIVSDDGLQHHALWRSHEWLVFDARGAGNRRLLPAGPLREPLTRLHTVDWVIASNVDLPALQEKLRMKAQANWVESKVELCGFRNAQTGLWLSAHAARLDWAGLDTLALTGLANPEKFFTSLRKVGLEFFETLALPDHFDFPDDFCAQLNSAILITTGKDAVKLPMTDPRLWVAEIQIELPTALTHALEDYIGFSTD